MASETPPDSIDALLRAARSPHDAIEALREAITALSREQAMHMRFYRGDPVADLARHLRERIVRE